MQGSTAWPGLAATDSEPVDAVWKEAAAGVELTGQLGHLSWICSDSHAFDGK